ncbi:uncharacterized protein FFB20_02179 [Fusarium fujikuroi]|uniref:Zn(2)-C6 fungal-type domain-containing protein n=2 Tax=Fusarium fujikuroi TaxID=5127 RepID=S0ELL8_GIBF5|nr:uncharacterized protein FFUJ_10867 [Fusarium fujikuroi IMI 58289]KLO98437.1 uncharacterized protein LW94_11753 [Fusarium fujikuroi]KLP03399.1 uncharacterized protein Y057_4683 [Fusarium fujikuroi]QGI70207.1 hypothetical protein CEK27_002536 [Fusarium fujikuroi]QGI87566.1 hypothetical protein CEK25_002522 [Fusarium fujikuroi]QGJ01096.1 hypothetical protein CEK26_002540 [Fusarium fujikuroi]
MSDIPAATEAQQYTRHTNGRRKRRARRACLTCRSRKVRCDVMQKSPCSNCQWSSCECVVIGPRRSPCKKNKLDNKVSKQPKKEEVSVEAARDILSYSYSPTSSDVEVKHEESRDFGTSYPPMDYILSPLTPISQLEDEYCFGSQYASSYADQPSSNAWIYPTTTSQSPPVSSELSRKEESDPIIYFGGDGISDDLMGSLLALPFDHLRHI